MPTSEFELEINTIIKDMDDISKSIKEALPSRKLQP